jgi:hypothetical protein
MMTFFTEHPFWATIIVFLICGTVVDVIRLTNKRK